MQRPPADDPRDARIQDLERRLQRKDTFLALLGHELRNPLAAIETTLEATRRGAVLPEDFLELAEARLREIRRLADDLFDVSQVERGLFRVERARVAALDVVVDALEIARPTLEEQGHRLEVELPAADLVIDGDRMRLVQVLVNLLTNSARCTEPPGRVELRAGRSETGKARFQVRDSGMGIAEDRLDALFDSDPPLETEEGGRTGRERGLGLGLFLVRHIVELHGGWVEAASDGPGSGATFRVELPVAPVEEGTRLRDVPLVGGWRILVVDDDFDLADSLAMLLERDGHVVRVAPSGEVALRDAESFAPEAVLLDVKLPRRDGWELASRFRMLPSDRRPVLISVSGDGSPESVRASREAGCVAHLLKPATPDRIREVLGRAGVDRRASR